MRQIIFYYICVYLTPHEEGNMLYVDPNWLHTDCEFKAFILIFPLAMRPYTTHKIDSYFSHIRQTDFKTVDTNSG